jgi:hypothetical protein
MKLSTLFVVIALFVGVMVAGPSKAEAYQRVSGYTRRSTGTYVMPYYRSNSNRYKFDNYSAKYNSNPFTGKRGYKSWY